MISFSLPPDVRLVSLSEEARGWRIYIASRHPINSNWGSGGPAPSIKLALIEALAMHNRTKAEAAKFKSPSIDIDLGDFDL